MRRMLLALALAGLLAGACAPPRFVGTEITPTAAPDLTLTDGISGRPVSLSAQRGKVVALAFLYTHCPDVCPLTAELFRQTRAALSPSERDRTLFAAISVDPRQDTPAAVQAFARDHGLGDGFVYLIGGVAQLQPVWSAWGIRVDPDAAPPTVGHSDAIYLLDGRGDVRALVHSDITPQDLANDLRLLLR